MRMYVPECGGVLVCACGCKKSGVFSEEPPKNRNSQQKDIRHREINEKTSKLEENLCCCYYYTIVIKNVKDEKFILFLY